MDERTKGQLHGIECAIAYLEGAMNASRFIVSKSCYTPAQRKRSQILLENHKELVEEFTKIRQAWAKEA